MTPVTWILESDVFPNSHAALRQAIVDAGLRTIDSNDDGWLHEPPEFEPGTPIVFHGSLGNAAISEMKQIWYPGSFCPVNDFCCTAWYPRTNRWLLHERWRCLSTNEFVANAADVAPALGCTKQLFVRPDSPLKPSSGRVLDVDAISLRSLDHGFYYEDEAIPVIVGRETWPMRSRWRCQHRTRSMCWTFARSATTTVCSSLTRLAEPTCTIATLQPSSKRFPSTSTDTVVLINFE